jgi:hypothetical protein
LRDSFSVVMIAPKWIGDLPGRAFPQMPTGEAHLEMLKYDVPTLQHCANVLRQAGEQLDGQVTNILAEVRGLGDFLGSDQIGRTFDAGFEKPKHATEEHLTKAGGALTMLGELLSFSVNEIVAEDAANAANFHRLSK